VTVRQFDQPGLRWRKRQRIVSRIPAPRIARARLARQIVPALPEHGRARRLERPGLKIDQPTRRENPFDLGGSPYEGEGYDPPAQLPTYLVGQRSAANSDERFGHSLRSKGRAALGLAADKGVHQHGDRRLGRPFPTR
jgi:hypothetical protein